MSRGAYEGSRRASQGELTRLKEVFRSYFIRVGGTGTEIIDHVDEAYLGTWGPTFYVLFHWHGVNGERKAGLFCETPPGNRDLRPRVNAENMTIELTTECPSHIRNVRDMFNASAAAKETNVAAFAVATSNSVGELSSNVLQSQCEIKILGLRTVKAKPDKFGTVNYTGERSVLFVGFACYFM